MLLVLLIKFFANCAFTKVVGN